MKTTLFRASLLASAWFVLHGELGAQSLEEVRDVVETYFGTDEQTAAAKSRLSEWSNEALPPLRSLADERDQKSAWAVICCISEIETPESLDLLVSVLEGKTRIPPDLALRYFFRLTGDPALAERLRGYTRFRPAIRAIASSDNWLQRKCVAEIAGAMDWPDFVPLIQQMLVDENAELRRAAAVALSKLTGRPVEAELPQDAFTDVQLLPALVADPTRIESTPDGTVTAAFLLPRLDGSSALMLGDGRTFRPWPGMEAAEALEYSVPTLDVLSLRTEGFQPQSITLVQQQGFWGAGADEAIARDKDGSELWRYTPPRRGLEAAAILEDVDGPYGVAFGPGGETGLVGIDPQGKTLWDIPRVHVLYGLETHPRLPGVMLVVHGGFSLVHHSPDGIDADEVTGAFMRGVRRGGERLYARAGLLYPGENGAPELVLSGMGPNSVPVLSCFDASYSRRWTVSFASRVTQLAMLEIVGRERLFVLTAGDELFLLNELGVLRWRGPLPSGEEGGEAFVFQLVAGDAGGRALIALSCKQGMFIYPVRAEFVPLATR